MNANFQKTKIVRLGKSIRCFKAEGVTLTEVSHCVGAGVLLTVGAPHFMDYKEKKHMAVPIEKREGLKTSVLWVIVNEMSLSPLDTHKLEEAYRETAAESLG